MIVLLGLICVDTFFTISAFLAFHYANKIYKEKGGLSILDILKLYAYRILRFVPGSYLVMLFGIYVMPWLHGGSDDRQGDPIWFSFEEVLFYECTEPKTLASKMLFYSNLYPYYQDDKSGCMQWTWTLEADIQLYLFIPFLVILYQKTSLRFMSIFTTCLMLAGIYVSYYVASYYKLTAGVFSLNNHNMLSMWMMKPYCKIHLFALGILSALYYEQIKEG